MGSSEASHVVTPGSKKPPRLLKDYGPYSIETIPANPSTIPLDSSLVASAHIATWVVFWSYLIRRVCLAWAATTATQAPISHWFVWLNITVEIMNILPEFIGRGEMFLYILFGRCPAHRPSYYLHGATAPAVDILITCCGEDTDVIIDTVAAAASQDYPNFRVFLLDDANDTDVQQAVHQFNARAQPVFAEVQYCSRPKPPGVPHYFKSGNIRFGFDESARDNGGADLVASLDADMIPETDWLRRTVPLLLMQPRVAMAIPPQRFYNIGRDNILGQDSRVFGVVVEPINNSLGGTCCTGSGYVVRRQAIEELGGWPLLNAGEDILCGWMLTSRDWEVQFVKDEVQFGLAPGSLAAWMKQRARWTDGNILAYRQLGWFGRTDDSSRHRSLIRRLVCLCHVFKTFVVIPNSIMFALLPWIWYPVEMRGGLSARGEQPPILHVLLLAALVLQKYSVARTYEQVNLADAKATMANRYWSIPLNVSRVFRSFLPQAAAVSFDITGTVVSAVQERSAKLRLSLFGRMTDRLTLVYVAWTLYTLTPITIRIYHYTMGGCSTSSTCRLVSPSPAAVVFWLTGLTRLSVPLRYMIRPPTAPDRREILTKDADGVYRVPEYVKRGEPTGGSIGLKDIIELGLVVYVAFGGSVL